MLRPANHTLFGIAAAAALGIAAVPNEPAESVGAVVPVTATPAVVVSDPTTSVPPPPVTAPEPPPTTAPPSAPGVPRHDPAPPQDATPAPVVPAPSPPPAPAPPTGPQERAEAALAEAVPDTWQQGLPVTIRIIDGSTSYASRSMSINVGRYHAEGRWSHLVSVIGHEYGHIIAYVYGTRQFNGAAPAGWPDPNHGPPAEAWADCVSEVFTNIIDPSYGMPPCPQPTRNWTADWLAAGPP